MVLSAKAPAASSMTFWERATAFLATIGPGRERVIYSFKELILSAIVTMEAVMTDCPFSISGNLLAIVSH